MNIERIGNNVTLLKTNHGDEVLYSYETAVAGFKQGIGYFKTNQFYSVTTSKHINSYLSGQSDVMIVYPEDIERLFIKENAS